jgi:2,3-bisphosphoglycerate-independent phosphoglycerate mutase
MSHTPLLLIILDGFGYRTERKDNAIALANTPFLNDLLKTSANTLISGSGCDVGLPDGQMGNSEVGHLNIGSGRVVQQDFTRIDAEIANGHFFKNHVLIDAIQKAKSNNKALHVLGLLSQGGVHSHENQIHALFELAQQQGLSSAYMHAFLDGRDTPPRSAAESIEKLEAKFRQLNCGKIASLIGRYYAMDRDKRWDRVESAYNLLTQGIATRHVETALAGLELAYVAGENDEFVKATSVHAANAKPITINDGDVVVFMNYRADRTREITHALTDTNFTHFNRASKPELGEFVTLTEYDATFKFPIAFSPLSHEHVLGDCISKAGMKQLRIAETEKYAHVTFFFNGGVETPFPGEDRELIPSPKVATYDLQPEMSAPLLTEKLVAAIQSKQYGVIICNYANADMVGHSGKLEATIKAIETLDQCLAKVVPAAQAVGGEVLITADHGNAEKMYDEQTKQPHTAHTSDPVPFIYVGRKATVTTEHGTLSDIAPTMLYLLGLPQPNEMTGKSLLAVE